MPHQANVAGNIHGGEIIKLMDSTAYATARRYARTNVVTARVDEVEFHLPIFYRRSGYLYSTGSLCRQ